MKNWKERGEVPDSDDDESSDDLDLGKSQVQGLDHPPIGLLLPDEPLQTAPDAHIWDIPSSPTRQERHENVSRGQEASEKHASPDQVAVSPPGKGRGSGDDLVRALVPERSDKGEVDSKTASETLPAEVLVPVSERPRSIDRSTSPAHEVAVPPSPLSSLSSVPSSALSLLRSRSPTPELPVFDDAPQEVNHVPHGWEQEDESRQAAVRLERSLRPRKPIQQHPYLLESAQYANLMKSRGVKPVRIPRAAEPEKQHEEDSQDQDFAADESQEASGGGRNGADEESNPILWGSSVDDLDELALSPSPKTSSLRRQVRLSSQRSSGDTDATSVIDEDEDMPTLDDILRDPTNAAKLSKRQKSRRMDSSRKRQKTTAQVLSSSPTRPFIRPHRLSSPPLSQHITAGPSSDLGATPLPAMRNRLEVHIPSKPSPRPTASPASPQRTEIVDFTHEVVDISDEGSDNDSHSASGSEASSDAETVRHHVRRLRGVLPASWLRLDQHKGKSVAREPRERRSPEQSPERVAPRRGVAMLRQSSPKPSTARVFSLDDFSDEDDEESPRGLPQEPSREIDNPSSSNMPLPIFDDDPGVGMEDNTIDPMTIGSKRSRSSTGRSRDPKRRRTQLSMFNDQPGQKTRQPRINQVLGRSKSMSTPAKGTSHSYGAKAPVQRSSTTSSRSAPRRRAEIPPLLSILDVMEPEAPNFVKIAARTAKRKKNLGKSSPSRKIISLATRIDNVDALSVLRDWKTGRTRPRVSVPQLETTKKTSSRRPLKELSTNTASHRFGSSGSTSTRASDPSVHPKAPRQMGLGEFTRSRSDLSHQASRVLQVSQPPKPAPRRILRLQQPQLRPAQLETDDTEGVGRSVFKFGKHALDSLYRKTQKGSSLRAPSIVSLESYFNSISPVNKPSDNERQSELPNPPRSNTKTRFKKRFVPNPVDLDAPQFTHANDPLPAPEVTEVAEEDLAVIAQDPLKDKLRGLGPYGSVYTQHFEVFPLDQGIYFHASTLIGSGCISKAVDPNYCEKLRHTRPRISFTLDERSLRWGPWEESTSSELGILVDWIADKLTLGSSQVPLAEQGPVAAAGFILSYVLDSLSFPQDSAEKSFVSRSLEVMQSFVARSESNSPPPVETKQAQAEVYARFTVAILAMYRVATANGSDYSLVVRIEDALTKIAKLCVKTLLDIGLSGLRRMYSDLQRASVRERGIRSSQFATNCWVILIRVLEHLQIPRSSFWDITYAVMLQEDVVSGYDAQKFEALWLDMFTLLPLSEFDNSGVLISGLRYNTPMEGWTLPQQLSKRVFDLYRANTRQPPSFNEYCRAVVSRSHYLVQQWGWSRCSSIVGTMFDFFGSQNLAHLRNEEVYKSPSFLDNLGDSPSLAIEPEDRCFHIFIKLLALAIQRLRKLDRINDIRNLVTRTLPNHNRQYSKEDTIHQRDLAALRNHHDLLCTLFWAAPPEVRPGVHLIEKLVAPESSHKEAVLINIRAWSQLADFLVSSGECSTSFKPFISWQNNVFQHLLDQYLSAASDIEQQFRALAGQNRDISTAMKDQMISRNKGAAMDGMYMTLKSSLEALKHAGTLETAVYALNIYQLQRVFGSLDYSSPRFDWSIVHVALDTVEHYTGRLDEAKAGEDQYSSEDVGRVDPLVLEDAVQLLDVRLVKDFFLMGRMILALPPSNSPRRANDQASCVEKTVVLGAKIATRFVKDRITLLAPYFTSPKYGLFSQLPKNLGSKERRYVPLFLATLVKNHVYTFSDLGSTLLELWMLSITKPSRYLQYENYLASCLKHNGLPFLQQAIIPATAPDYNANRDYFQCALRHMRKALRDAGSTQARQLREEYKGILVLLMRRMKQDLQDLVSEANEHKAYIVFVRQAISLIKSHGVGICVVDPFFTQPSLEYSPPQQDPQLHVDGIIGYGVKIGENDPTAVPQLFHYLYNNFKIALANDKLKEETSILERAMLHSDIVSFMLQFMLPTIVEASSAANEAWLLLDVYVGALGNTLTRSCLPMELRGKDVKHSIVLLETIVRWFLQLRDDNPLSVSTQQVHILHLLVKLANAQQSSIQTWLCSPSPMDEESVSGLENLVSRARTAVEALQSFTQEAAAYLHQILSLDGTSGAAIVNDVSEAILQSEPLLSGLSSVARIERFLYPRAVEFAQHIVVDVKRNWVVTPSLVRIQMAGKPISSAVSGTPAATGSQSRNGTSYRPWGTRDQIKHACDELSRWRLEVPSLGGRDGGAGRRDWRRQRVWERGFDEELIF
ncbi:hypothetical protein GQ53DRAFT_837621 [Thozetella sp. PMI_491]|nr:hypothetical protein GQ53DRAFT_837621 [Thozetella sp. PMI_491]